MAVNGFLDLLDHVGHDTEVVKYGRGPGLPQNVAVECTACGEVLFDFDLDDAEHECYCGKKIPLTNASCGASSCNKAARDDQENRL